MLGPTHRALDHLEVGPGCIIPEDQLVVMSALALQRVIGGRMLISVAGLMTGTSSPLLLDPDFRRVVARHCRPLIGDRSDD